MCHLEEHEYASEWKIDTNAFQHPHSLRVCASGACLDIDVVAPSSKLEYVCYLSSK